MATSELDMENVIGVTEADLREEQKQAMERAMEEYSGRRFPRARRHPVWAVPGPPTPHARGRLRAHGVPCARPPPPHGVPRARPRPPATGGPLLRSCLPRVCPPPPHAPRPLRPPPPRPPPPQLPAPVTSQHPRPQHPQQNPIAGRAQNLPVLRRCRGFTSVQALYVDTDSCQLPQEEVIYCYKRGEKEILQQEGTESTHPGGVGSSDQESNGIEENEGNAGSAPS
ncbi:neural Wiskott-Aldrich syndrome protein-like [Sorghum bicolor]|uniref:neural Wiskott-Aldrich syndrome protein-like n=1 Tax=Sorghum bicolor TaxID=4558 RepID=UPI000B425AB1|nr:neural Wiskott-Aldrich syndrome protein-like [Sorghum bicolor]|eukprot:XP_021309097.1 neural Wiskott-Aldrich syndrome protein-like [Sorghum bicolor]